MFRKIKLFKVKVINRETKRIDYHDDLSEFDIGWLRSMPNLKVDISEVYFREIDDERKSNF